MTNKIKQNLSYVLCAALGLLTFIVSAFAYAVVEVNFYGANKSYSGYNLLGDEWSAYGDVVSTLSTAAVFQVIILIFAGLMLAYGACGILKAIGAFNQFPEAIGSVKTKLIARVALWVFACLNVLQFIFLVMGVTDGAFDGVADFRLSAGIFISLILSLGAAVAEFFLDKKFGDSE